MDKKIKESGGQSQAAQQPRRVWIELPRLERENGLQRRNTTTYSQKPTVPLLRGATDSNRAPHEPLHSQSDGTRLLPTWDRAAERQPLSGASAGTGAAARNFPPPPLNRRGLSRSLTRLFLPTAAKHTDKPQNQD
ncbi:Hypothetical predicted protein, partial [Pelobates cultripes]